MKRLGCVYPCEISHQSGLGFPGCDDCSSEAQWEQSGRACSSRRRSDCEETRGGVQLVIAKFKILRNLGFNLCLKLQQNILVQHLDPADKTRRNKNNPKKQIIAVSRKNDQISRISVQLPSANSTTYVVTIATQNGHVATIATETRVTGVIV